MDQAESVVQSADSSRHLGNATLAGVAAHFGRLIVAVTVLVAVGLALLVIGAGSQLPDRGFWHATADIVGVTAAILLCCSVLVAARPPLIRATFGDITHLYVAHAILGLLGLAFVTLHPIGYFLGVLESNQDVTTAASQLVPFRFARLDWIAWVLMVVGLIPTLWLHMRSSIWRWTHVIPLGLALVLTVIEITTTSFLFTTSVPALRIYMWAIFGAAIAGWLYAAFVRPFANTRHEHHVIATRHHEETDSIEIDLIPVHEALEFRPGQFFMVEIIDPRARLRRNFHPHPLTPITHHHDDVMTFVIRANGTWSKQVQNVTHHERAKALVHGPFGQMGQSSSRQRQVWLAGGSGITPFLSMARHMARSTTASDDDLDIVLVVSVRHRSQAFYWEALREYESSCPGLRIVLWESSTQGHLDEESLIGLVPDIASRSALISGPPALLAAMRAALIANGVSPAHIDSEHDIGPPKSWSDASKALRFLRIAVTAEVCVFVALAIASGIIAG